MQALKAAALLLVLAPAAAHAQVRQDEAIDLLRKSMERAMQINVIAVIERRSELDGLMRKVKLEQAKGRQALTVLHPLSSQGITYVDDGHVRMTYVPDERTLFEETSIRPLLRDIEARIELTAKNYSLRTEPSERVAGRPTLKVVATPRDQSLPARQFILDEKTLFLLRMATVAPGGERNVQIDTKVVSYPKTFDESCLKVEALGASRKVVRHPAMPVEVYEGLATKLGFEPAIPARLPLGFVIRGAELRRSSSARSFTLRITDGLASAQVYQFRSAATPAGLKLQGNRATLTENGISTTLVSDLPETARIQILGSFAKKPIAIAKRETPSPTPGTGGARVMPVPAPEPKATFRVFPSEEEWRHFDAEELLDKAFDRLLQPKDWDFSKDDSNESCS